MRLIDVDARITEIRKAYCTGCDNYQGVRCRSCWVDDAIGLFDDAPTVDAKPVVHGRCDWCKQGDERCGTCKNFFTDDGSRCSAEHDDIRCAYYEPMNYCISKIFGKNSTRLLFRM